MAEEAPNMFDLSSPQLRIFGIVAAVNAPRPTAPRCFLSPRRAHTLRQVQTRTPGAALSRDRPRVTVPGVVRAQVAEAQFIILTVVYTV